MKRPKMINWLPVLIVLAGCITIVLPVVLGGEDPLPEIVTRPLSVETARFHKTDYQVRVPAWGFVEPRETIDIQAEISGKITDVPDNIFPGAAVKRGMLLFAIDERNYINALAEATAATKQARQALEIEKGRQIIARTEWKLLNSSKFREQKNKALALRRPQLEEREAAVQIAVARQTQAALDVERTRVTAPCEGVILTENLARGRVLDTGDVALQIACTECYQIMALFSPEYLLDPAGRAVTIDIGPNRYDGIVKSVLPQISLETRRKQALVEFGGKHITLGAYALLTLSGLSFNNVVLLPKEAVRPGNTVWILNESNKLEIRPVTIRAQDMLNAVVGKGLTGRDRVILSHIASPLQGMELTPATPDAKGPQQSSVTKESNK